MDEEIFRSKEEVATGLIELHKELCGTCQIRLEQNKCRQGFGWEMAKERTVWKTCASEGNECYG
jgi:hypothetical protein